MLHSSKRFPAILAIAILTSLLAIGVQGQQPVSASPDLNFPTVLYGAAYYN